MVKLKIDGISQDKTQFGTKITLESGKNKYIFYSTKKDGTRSRAYDQFKNADWGVGDTIECEIAEEEKTFKGKDGNEVKYTERRIMFFSEGEQGAGTPISAQKMTLQPSKPESKGITPPASLTPKQGDSEALVIAKQLSAEVNGLRKRIEDLENLNGSGNPF